MFAFNTTPSLLVGRGASRSMAARLKALLGPRILLVTDAGLRKAGLVEPVLASLEAEGLNVAVVDRVSADPPEAEVLDGLELALAHQATGVLGFGGGSPMDVAKVIALLAGSLEKLSEAYGVGLAKGRACRWPLCQPRPAPARR